MSDEEKSKGDRLLQSEVKTSKRLVLLHVLISVFNFTLQHTDLCARAFLNPVKNTGKLEKKTAVTTNEEKSDEESDKDRLLQSVMKTSKRLL